MRPLSPTAHPSTGEVIEIDRILSVRAYSCSYHLAPPVDVWRTVPYSPTAQPSEVSMNCTWRRLFPWGKGDCQFHCANKDEAESRKTPLRTKRIVGIAFMRRIIETACGFETYSAGDSIGSLKCKNN